MFEYSSSSWNSLEKYIIGMTARRRYVMEHAGSDGKVTAAQMWDFCHKCFDNNELDIVLAYEKMHDKKISCRMHKLIKKIVHKI